MNVSNAQESTVKRLKLTELPRTLFNTRDGRQVTISEATPQEFDDFLSLYVDVENVDRSTWPLLVRWRALNFALKQGCQLAIERQEMTA